MGPAATDMENRIDITWIQFCTATDERLRMEMLHNVSVVNYLWKKKKTLWMFAN